MITQDATAEHLLDHYGECDRDTGRINNCYWGKDEFGNWNGCLRTGWRGRMCQHWKPVGATTLDQLFDAALDR